MCCCSRYRKQDGIVPRKENVGSRVGFPCLPLLPAVSRHWRFRHTCWWMPFSVVTLKGVLEVCRATDVCPALQSSFHGLFATF
jgi:hypothetical protein